MHLALLRAFDGFEISTTGGRDGAQRLSIDHIAHTTDIVPDRIEIWLDRSDDGKRL